MDDHIMTTTADGDARLRRTAALLAAAVVLALGALHTRTAADADTVLVLPAADAPIASSSV